MALRDAVTLERVTICIPAPLLQQLERVCKHEDRSRSAVLRRALQAYLSDGRSR